MIRRSSSTGVLEVAGGRGVDLAEEIDRLTKRKERLDKRFWAEVSPPIKNQDA